MRFVGLVDEAVFFEGVRRACTRVIDGRARHP